LKESLRKAKEKHLLDGYNVFIPAKARANIPKTDLKGLIESAGGVLLDSVGEGTAVEKLLVVTTQEAVEGAKEAASSATNPEGKNVYSLDFLWSSLVRQEFDWSDEHVLINSAEQEEQPKGKAGKSKRGKK